MAVQWTTEQRAAIEARGSDLLLSAAAGSGKTAVLVERILERIADPSRPVDIDRLLVVTFTNAAAAQMRDRISAALEARLEAEPENAHLQRQVTLVHHAKITTIHSFCLDVIRSHTSQTSLEPDFRIPDEGERSLLLRDVAAQVIEESYQAADPDFLALSEMLSGSRTSDSGLEDLLLSVYEFSMGDPQPGRWREECVRLYEEGAVGDSHPWMQAAARMARLRMGDLLETAREAAAICAEPDGPQMYADALADDCAMLERLCREESWSGLARAFDEGLAFTTLGRKKYPDVSEEKKARVKALRDGVKKDLGNLRDRYFYASPEEMEDAIRRAAAPVRALMALAGRFHEAFDRKKREKNLADFNDLEHFALNILVSAEGEDYVPTPAAVQYRRHFEEVMIDEYQDSNLVQEILLGAVSREGEEADRFMVGDVKQSIYRFRLARPELFLEKYHDYREKGTGTCIHLRRNFRSRHQVLTGVNRVFEKIMTPALGGIEYDADAALYPGADYPEAEDPDPYLPELLLLGASQDGPADDEEEGEPSGEETDQSGDGEESAAAQDARRLEARAAARRIREIVGTLPVYDREKGGMRPAGYGDIAVLLRTVRGWAEPFADVFAEEGIPVYSGSGAGYFSATEVRTILSYLQVLDNPRQDIPLAAVLRSPIGGMTDEDLAKIRLAGAPGDDFYTCCQACLAGERTKTADKLAAFTEMTGRMRDLVPYTPVHRLLWIIYEETGFLDYASALPGGAVRRANLEMLAGKAAQYEAGSYSGLYQFVRYIELLKRYEVDYGEAPSAEDAGDTVRILSIHKSKGLEFPIVFVCGLGKRFNRTDAYSSVVMHHELGIGFELKDPVLRVKEPLLSRNVIGRTILEESLGEELRVLYVAMTRAKEKLIMTGRVRGAEDKMEKWSAMAEKGGPLSYSALSGAEGFLDWLMPAVLAETGRGEETFILRLADEAQQGERSSRDTQDVRRRRAQLLAADPDEIIDPAAAAELKRVLSLTMPHEAAAAVPGKLSVSELKHAAIEAAALEEEGASLMFPDPVPDPLVPRFRKKEEDSGRPRGAEHGTAMHRIMEVLDLSAEPADDFLDSQLERLLNCGKIQKDVLELADTGKIRAFLASPLARRMRDAARAGRLVREQPFTLGFAASRIDPGWPEDEEVLVQGIIDAYFEEEDGIVLVDYKTDYVPGGDGKFLVDRYRTQLTLYREALERVTGRPVKQMLLYSFNLGREVEVR